ncbi:helix-turn-helix domain-containing protein [Streptomyces sp. NBC_01387]|nr:helix-turn-helix transcriptional regulator [Streptomyces sp. NBC_01500]MCX4548579.1 helix-turn-helix domain-containing protein [Streptomyces sp. NBC_01500]
MPPRTTPTLRQRRLGAELRKLREQAGLSTRQAGELLSTDPARVSNTEAGRFGVSPERVRMVAYNYGCQNEELIAALAGMAAGRGRGWWDDYREMLPAVLLDLAEMEHHATALRTTQVMHLPGLFQTLEYARLVFRQNIPALPQSETEFRVSQRLKRQHVLFRENPVPYLAIIHEAGLRMMFGDRDTTREQLEHLIAMGERANVTLQVIPFSAGLVPGAGQTVVLAEGPVPQLDTVQLDTEHGSVFLDAETQLAKYRTLVNRLEGMALNPDASREMIRSIINSL